MAESLGGSRGRNDGLGTKLGATQAAGRTGGSPSRPQPATKAYCESIWARRRLSWSGPQPEPAGRGYGRAAQPHDPCAAACAAHPPLQRPQHDSPPHTGRPDGGLGRTGAAGLLDRPATSRPMPPPAQTGAMAALLGGQTSRGRAMSAPRERPGGQVGCAAARAAATARTWLCKGAVRDGFVFPCTPFFSRRVAAVAAKERPSTPPVLRTRCAAAADSWPSRCAAMARPNRPLARPAASSAPLRPARPCPEPSLRHNRPRQPFGVPAKAHWPPFSAGCAPAVRESRLPVRPARVTPRRPRRATRASCRLETSSRTCRPSGPRACTASPSTMSAWRTGLPIFSAWRSPRACRRAATPRPRRWAPPRCSRRHCTSARTCLLSVFF